MKLGSPTLLHRLRHTPLTDVLRGRVTARLDWRGMIERSELPAPLRELVMFVVRRTRLWRSERVEVALELVAHFHDGLHAGRTAEQLIAGFGDPRVAAKLIRRGKVRNRPLTLQAARRLSQGVTIVVVLYLLAASLLYFAKPKPGIDYLAQLNAPVAATPSEDHAWPIYKPAWIEHDVWSHKWQGELYVESQMPWNQRTSRPARPGDPSWPRARAALVRYASLVDATRWGSEKPVFGLRPLIDHPRGEERLMMLGPKSPQYLKDTPPANESLPLVSTLIPTLGWCRQLANLMLVDIGAGFEKRDSARVVDDYRAILGLARQARGVQSVIEQLVSAAVVTQGVYSLGGLAHEFPEALSDRDLTTLSHMAWQSRDLCEINFKTEEMTYHDVVQRSYTGEGEGGGWMTAEGWRLTSNVKSSDPFPGGPRDEWKNKAYFFALGPAVAVGVAGRGEATRAIREYFTEGEELARLPLWELLNQQRANKLDEKAKEMVQSFRLRHIGAMLPALGSAAREGRKARATVEALAVALAVERFRRENRRYPDTLAELVPRYVPEAPLDHSTGKPLLMTLRDGRPVLYGRGLDGNDDHGAEPPRGATGMNGLPTKGDWILYPPKVHPEVAPAAGSR